MVGLTACVVSALCAHAQSLEAEDITVRQAVHAVQADRVADAENLQDALVSASTEEKAILVQQYVAQDRARVAEIRTQREFSTEPVLIDRSVGIEDAAVREAIQAEDQAVAGGVALVEAMKTLSPAEATEAFLAWEHSAERKALLPAAGEEVVQSLPVLEEWVAAENASTSEKELAAAHNRLNARILNYMESTANLQSETQSEAFLLLDQQIRADRETIRQFRKQFIKTISETHD